MNFNDLETRLSAFKDKYEQLSGALIPAGIIDEYPDMVFQFESTSYNTTSFRLFWDDFYLAKNRFNWLITVTNYNGFLTDYGELLDVVDFNTPDTIAGNDLVNYYDKQLGQIEQTMNQLESILVDNNIVKEAANGG